MVSKPQSLEEEILERAKATQKGHHLAVAQVVHAALRTERARAFRNRSFGVSICLASAGLFLWFLLHGIATLTK